MKITITESDIRLLAERVVETMLKDGRDLPKSGAVKVRDKADSIARDVYGDQYGEQNAGMSRLYGVDVKKNADVGSVFSIGNKKLSNDTLIINFTSALGCPSVKVCPITQKACYAVAGENRLPATRRKNLIVQNLWRKAEHQGKLQDMFDLAEMYIEILKNTKLPIRYIRFNEAGDFFSQKLLAAAADFADKMREQYGVMSMAYTANKRLDFRAEVNGKPIDKIIKINASREDIKRSPDTIHQAFYGIDMDFEKVLANNDKVEEISDKEANRLKCAGTEGDRLSVPRLTWGKWNGGEGWYYVCPCSFWRYNKNKAEEKFYRDLGLLPADVAIEDSDRQALKSQLTPQQAASLKRLLNKVDSPCGRECAVCHDMQGGVTPDGQVVKDYAVLTATHGSGKGNYDPHFANEKRKGNDDVAWKGNAENPYGLERKYNANNKRQ